MSQRPPASHQDQPGGDLGNTAGGFTRDPVAGTTAAEVFLAASQRAPLLALLQGLGRGEPLMVITGEAGVGKTTLLESVLPAGEGGETQRIWCGSETGEPFTQARAALEVASLNLDVSEGYVDARPQQSRRAILIIDDAHLLTPEAAGYLIDAIDEAGSGPRRLQLVLVGRPDLWTCLRAAAVVDRVKVSGEVTGLLPSEAREYLRERLEWTGTPIDDILTEGARLALLSRAQWTPAELNKVLLDAGSALVGQGGERITRQTIEQAILLPGVARAASHWPDPELTDGAGRPRFLSRLQAVPRAGRRAAMALTALLAVLACGVLYTSGSLTSSARLVAERTSSKPNVSASNATAGAPAAPPAGQPLQNVSPAPGFAATAADATPPNDRPKAAARPASEQDPRAAVQADPVGRAASQAPPAADPGARSQRLALTMPTAQVDEIFRRGEAMLARGEISAARALYKKAARANSAAAATVVGKTYDPLFLAGIGATTIKPAPSRAAAWYRRAAELGDKEGQDRLAQLRSRSSQVAGND